MNESDWAALALDAQRVDDALAALTWYLRGSLSNATSNRQHEAVDRALSIAEGAKGMADVVAAEVGRLHGESASAGEGEA